LNKNFHKRKIFILKIHISRWKKLIFIQKYLSWGLKKYLSWGFEKYFSIENSRTF